MSSNYTPDEPIAAIATALAPSALSVIRLSGKGCVGLLSKCFSRPKALLEAQGNTIVYGWVVDSQENRRVDEVLVSVFRSPKSYTGEEMCEISCHGGINPVTAIFKLLLKNGFRTAERGEFTFRAFVNGKLDLTRSEAVREIIESKTDSSRNLALGRLSGNLYENIQEIKEKIIKTIASIEVELEYPEDEENFSDTFDDKLLRSAKASLEELSASWKSQKLYQDGARVILCGKTNAGKSRLFNTLLKEERSIVSDIEGTTRDWIESWVSFDGIPARLFDTAGLRNTDDTIEKCGVQMTKDLSKSADLIIYLIDVTRFSGSNKENEDDEAFIKDAEKNIPVVRVLNKIDKLENCECFGRPDDKNGDFHRKGGKGGGQANCGGKANGGDVGYIKISAKTGQGISDLIQAVKSRLLDTQPTEREQSGLGSERQKIAIDEALESINHALNTSLADYTLDALVQDLEDALESLGEITGEVTPDDILESIFSNFCVGK